MLFFSEPVIEKKPSEKLEPTTKKQPAVKPQDLEYFNQQIATATDAKDFENKSVNTSKHEAEKAKIELRFFEILESDDLFVGLADIVMDEDNVPTRRMYSLVNGIKSKSKYECLNAVCLRFSRNYKMQTALKLLPDALDLDKAMCEYEPGSCHKNLKMLFCIFKEKRELCIRFPRTSTAKVDSTSIGRSSGRSSKSFAPKLDGVRTNHISTPKKM